VLLACVNAKETMSKLYSIISNVSEFCLRHRKTTLFSGIIISLAVLTCIAVFILQDFPNSGDEYTYLYQAKTFLAGRLSNQPHSLQEFFDFYWILTFNNKVFGQYLPGWPIVLATGMLLKIPPYMVNPILATLSLIIMFLLGRKLYNEKIAFLAVIVTFCSSFFLFNSASYFAHALCSLLILLFVYFAVSFTYKENFYHALLTGVFFGAACLVRPFPPLMCGLPIFAYLILKKPKHLKRAVWFVLGGMPFVACLLLYDLKTTGDALLPPFLLNAINLKWGISLTSAKSLAWNILTFITWTPPALLLIYIFYSLVSFRAATRGFIEYIFYVLVIGVFFYTMSPGNQYGPRYYYEAFPFLVLFTIFHLFKEDSYSQKNIIGKLFFWIFILSLILSIPFSIHHLYAEKQVIWERRDMYRTVEKEQINNAVVLIGTWVGTTRPMNPKDLTRNELDYSNDVVYALNRQKENIALMDFYPERDFYLYSYNRDAQRGSLILIRKKLVDYHK
jgi:hypothetical protein